MNSYAFVQPSTAPTQGRWVRGTEYLTGSKVVSEPSMIGYIPVLAPGSVFGRQPSTPSWYASKPIHPSIRLGPEKSHIRLSPTSQRRQWLVQLDSTRSLLVRPRRQRRQLLAILPALQTNLLQASAPLLHLNLKARNVVDRAQRLLYAGPARATCVRLVRSQGGGAASAITHAAKLWVPRSQGYGGGPGFGLAGGHNGASEEAWQVFAH